MLVLCVWSSQRGISEDDSGGNEDVLESKYVGSGRCEREEM